MGRLGKEAQSQANTLKDKVLVSVQAFEDGKEKRRLSIGACGTLRALVPGHHSMDMRLANLSLRFSSSALDRHSPHFSSRWEFHSANEKTLSHLFPYTNCS